MIGRAAALAWGLLAAGGAAAQDAVAYVCDNGSDVTATYGAAGEGVTLDMGSGATSTLAPAAAETGARYLGEGLSWVVDGEAATLAPLTPDTEELADPGTRCFSGGYADQLRAEVAAGMAFFVCESGTEVQTFEAPRDTLVLFRDDEPGAALTALPTAGYGRLWGGDGFDWRLFEDGTAELTDAPSEGSDGGMERCARVR